MKNIFNIFNESIYSVYQNLWLVLYSSFLFALQLTVVAFIVGGVSFFLPPFLSISLYVVLVVFLFTIWTVRWANLIAYLSSFKVQMENQEKSFWQLTEYIYQKCAATKWWRVGVLIIFLISFYFFNELLTNPILIVCAVFIIFFAAKLIYKMLANLITIIFNRANSEIESYTLYQDFITMLKFLLLILLVFYMYSYTVPLLLITLISNAIIVENNGFRESIIAIFYTFSQKFFEFFVFIAMVNLMWIMLDFSTKNLNIMATSLISGEVSGLYVALLTALSIASFFLVLMVMMFVPVMAIKLYKSPIL